MRQERVARCRVAQRGTGKAENSHSTQMEHEGLHEVGFRGSEAEPGGESSEREARRWRRAAPPRIWLCKGEKKGNGDK